MYGRVNIFAWGTTRPGSGAGSHPDSRTAGPGGGDGLGISGAGGGAAAGIGDGSANHPGGGSWLMAAGAGRPGRITGNGHVSSDASPPVVTCGRGAAESGREVSGRAGGSGARPYPDSGPTELAWLRAQLVNASRTGSIAHGQICGRRQGRACRGRRHGRARCGRRLRALRRGRRQRQVHRGRLLRALRRGRRRGRTRRGRQLRALRRGRRPLGWPSRQLRRRTCYRARRRRLIDPGIRRSDWWHLGARDRLEPGP